MSDLSAWLDEVEARCDAATEGPWKYKEPEDAESSNEWKREGYVYGPAVLPIHDTVSFEPPDSRFIAHARTDLPRALEVIRRFVTVLREVDEEIQLRRHQQMLIDRRGLCGGNSFGIAVADDDLALEWQDLEVKRAGLEQIRRETLAAHPPDTTDASVGLPNGGER